MIEVLAQVSLMMGPMDLQTYLGSYFLTLSV